MEGLAFLGIFLGCFSRAIFPYLKKLREAANTGQTIHFEARYWIAPAISLVTSAISALIAFSSFSIPDDTRFVVFQLAFGFGWGLSDIFNDMMN